MKSVLIYGLGCAGLTCATYLGQAGIKIFGIEDWKFPSSITGTQNVINFPGFANISGSILIHRMKQQAENYGLELVEEFVETDYILFSTGSKPRKIQLPVEEEKIHYCAVCDGNLYCDKKVLVLGGGCSAFESALYLSEICKEVHIYFGIKELMRDAWAVYQKRILETENIKIVRQLEYNYDGYFVYKGRTPNIEPWLEYLEIIEPVEEKKSKRIEFSTKDNFLLTDYNTGLVRGETKIYGAGDIEYGIPKQAVIACARGAMVALDIIKKMI